MMITISMFLAYIPGWMNDNEEQNDSDDDYSFHVPCLYPWVDEF